MLARRKRKWKFSSSTGTSEVTTLDKLSHPHTRWPPPSRFDWHLRKRSSENMKSSFFLVLLLFQTANSWPHNIIPLSYDLLFKLPIHEFNGFTGSMVLHFNLSSLSDNITLDAVDLHSFRNISLIRSADLTEPTLKSIKILKEKVELKFEKSLFPGQYLLTIGECILLTMVL